MKSENLSIPTILQYYNNLVIWQLTARGGRIDRVWASRVGDREFNSRLSQPNDLKLILVNS